MNENGIVLGRAVARGERRQRLGVGARVDERRWSLPALNHVDVQGAPRTQDLSTTLDHPLPLGPLGGKVTRQARLAHDR